MTNYFGEQWLSIANIKKFEEYLSEIQYPLQALEIPEKKDNILNGIIELSSDPCMLFNYDTNTLNSDLEKLLSTKTKHLYRQWKQEVKGKSRTLSVPNSELEKILERYVKNIIFKKSAHQRACGGEPGWSTAKMIKMHMPFGSALNCDIYHAFESVKSGFIFEFYYDLASKYLPESISKDTAGFLTNISTVDYHNDTGNALPQGSLISMALFNRILYPIDEVLEELCQDEGIKYSRWVDDIILTSPITYKDHQNMTSILTKLREKYPLPIHKAFFQNIEPFYLLGQEIQKGAIIKSHNDIAKNSRQPIEEFYYNK